MRFRAPVLLLIACLVQGCASVTLAGSSAVDGWIRTRGGLASDDLTAKLRDASAPIIRCVEGKPVELCVLDSDAVAAYAWPNRRIFVTRGLINIATRDELTAAVAHELGHLLDDRHRSNPSAVVGTSGDDAETRADRLGCQLLDAAGVPRSAMRSLLQKVRAADSTPDSCRARIDQRISALRRASAEPSVTGR